MDPPSNPNFWENNGNWNTGIAEQNFHVNGQLTLTTAVIESIRQQPLHSGPLFQGGQSGSNNSINLISSEPDLPGTNRTHNAAGTEQMMMRQQQSDQRQPADHISSADSSKQNYHHPVNNQNTAAETEQMRRQQQSGQRQLPDRSTADSASVQLDNKRKRKRDADKRYKEKMKKQRVDMENKVTTLINKTKSLEEQLEKQREDMELKVTKLEAENKSLQKQLAVKNQRCETQQKELDKQQELRAENDRVKDKYIRLLETCNCSRGNPRFGTQSNELGQQRGQTTNISSEGVFGCSGIDSISQGHDQGEH